MSGISSELFIVSGYAAHLASIREACDDLGVSPVIIEWDLLDARLVSVLADAFRKHGRPDVIISRGAVADDIANAFADIVVLRAEPDDLDFLEVLAEAAKVGSKIGCLIYAQHVVGLKIETARKILGLKVLREYLYRSNSDVEKLVIQGRKDGMDAMAGGDYLGKRTGESLGYPVFFVSTGKRAIRNAISQAMGIIEARRGGKRRLRSLKTVVASVQEGILTLRGDKITLANEVVVDMLQLPRDKAQVQDELALTIDDLDPLLRRFLAGDSAAEGVVRIKGQAFFCKKIPLADASQGDETMLICSNVTEIQQREQKIRRELHAKGFVARYHFKDIIGESMALRRLIDKARTFAETDASILIHGESGTGKELFAQSIHNASSRQNRPFVAVNCAAIPETLLESELFGYEEGAFSGARRSGKPGLFELAHEGTIFLDEIDSLPISLQGVLLRVIQEKQVRRVGSQSIISVDARIISATNGNIELLVEGKAFRSDLYYRLNVLNLGLPSLAERREDVLLLAEHFLNVYAAKCDTTTPVFSESDKALLLSHSWNGNVRELENVVRRYAVLSKTGEKHPLGQCLDAAAAKPGFAKSAQPEGIVVARASLAEIERQVILRCLTEHRWNKQEVANRLGICRATLWRKLKNAGL